MGNIISTELLKIKRYSVVKAGLFMMSLSVLMSCFYSTASTNKVWDFQYFTPLYNFFIKKYRTGLSDV